MDETSDTPLEAPKASASLEFQAKHLLGAALWGAVAGACAMHGGRDGLILLVAFSLVLVGFGRRTCFLTLAGLVLLAFVGLTNMTWTNPGARRAACSNNLKQIGMALHNYHEAHGCFPPAYIADDSGRPMHSWRVLILPFMERNDLYHTYDFDEPWNGPNNSKLAEYGAQLFHCYSQPDETPGESTQTNYVAVVGPNAAWRGGESLRLADFLDGTSNTIMLVEVADSGINWMEPRDLYIGQMTPSINPTSGQGISSYHQGGANVAFADASVRFLRDELDPKALEKVLTRSGGEPVDMGDIDP